MESGSMMKKYVLRLYISGTHQTSLKAIANLREILKEPKINESFDFEVIDIINNPQIAEDQKIIATPVLIKHYPLPNRRIIGTLSDKKKVIIRLNLLQDYN